MCIHVHALMHHGIHVGVRGQLVKTKNKIQKQEAEVEAGRSNLDKEESQELGPPFDTGA